MSNLYNFGNILQALERIGLSDILVFLLVFTVLFAVLEKTHVMGEGKRNLNVVVSLIMAILFMVPDYSTYLGFSPKDIIKRALPSVSLIAVAVIMLLILIGLFAHDKVLLGLTMPGWIAFFSIVAIIIIFGEAAGWYASGFNSWLSSIFGNDALAVVIMLLVFGIIIAFITGGSKDAEAGNNFKRLGIDFKKLFGGD